LARLASPMFGASGNFLQSSSRYNPPDFIGFVDRDFRLAKLRVDRVM
jgi:hypothetical protein